MNLGLLMKSRCYLKSHRNYKDYGGRGIKVCERWLDPIMGCINFVEDMGERPSKKFTLHRIDNNSDYCKENCVWATRKIQDNHKRNNRLIEFKGKIQL